MVEKREKKQQPPKQTRVVNPFYRDGRLLPAGFKVPLRLLVELFGFSQNELPAR